MFATLALILSAAQFAAPATSAPAPLSVPRAVHLSVPPAPRGTAANLGADARMARADSLLFAGRLDKARDLYRDVISDETEAGHYAREAYWHLAVAFDLNDNTENTARTLDQLAEAAATFGDPQTELSATFESARLHALMRDGRTAMDRVARVRCLMQSPAIPDDVKAGYQARIIEDPDQR